MTVYFCQVSNEVDAMSRPVNTCQSCRVLADVGDFRIYRCTALDTPQIAVGWCNSSYQVRALEGKDVVDDIIEKVRMLVDPAETNFDEDALRVALKLLT